MTVFFPMSALAIEDPRTLPNNKVGVHILFPQELDEAASLINSNGGAWGYVIIPIQANDKDLAKWQTFMDKAREQKVIPIIRIATEGDYFVRGAWRTPEYTDVLDFANFLNSLTWPTKNRYVVIYNEVNRADEWGGKVDPAAYARILSYSVTAFKERSTDFFIISAGMDNAAANTPIAMDQYTYYTRMDQALPGIFNQIDGFGSHAYPNPGFRQPPSVRTRMSVTSFQFEREHIRRFTSKSLPWFITETGWEATVLPQAVIAEYMRYTFENIWNDPDVVAVTPFLLRAHDGPFIGFSLIDKENRPTLTYQSIAALPKVEGQPSLSSPPSPTPKTDVLAAEMHPSAQPATFTFGIAPLLNSAKRWFDWIFSII
jgi:hypothetical protein